MSDTDTTKDNNTPPENAPLPDVSHIKPAEKHFPVTKAEVDAFADRMEDISRILNDFLHEDPLEAEERRRQREKAREEEQARIAKQKLIDRYDPRRYVRFESDELINNLLADVDKKQPETQAAKSIKERISNLTDFERLTHEEAERHKSEGNKSFAAQDWKKAHELYSRAISLEVTFDPELVLALHNNRSQVNINLHNFVEAVEDASHVLKRHPTNTKACLRRATALSALHRPHEAFQDLQMALKGDAKNVEALRLIDVVTVEKAEMELCFQFEQTCATAKTALSDAMNVVQQYLQQIDSADTADNNSSSSSQCLQALSGICTILLEEPGSTVFFRIHNGLDHVKTLADGILGHPREPPAAPAAAEVDGVVTAAAAADEVNKTDEKKKTRKVDRTSALLVIACIRAIALTLNRSQVALSSFTRVEAEHWIAVAHELITKNQQGGLGAFKLVSDAQEAHMNTVVEDEDEREDERVGSSTSALERQKKRDIKKKQQQQTMNSSSSSSPIALAGNASLQLLEAFCRSKEFTSIVVSIFSLKEMETLLTTASAFQASLYYTLRFADALLRTADDAAQKVYQGVDFLLPCLAALCTQSLPLCEAAIGLLLRLTVVQPEKAEVLARDEVLTSLCAMLERALAHPQEVSPVIQEGIYGLFYNRLLQCKDRAAMVASLEKKKLFDTLLVSLERYQLGGGVRGSSTSATTTAPVNVVARSLAVLGKCVSVANKALVAKIAAREATLWQLLSSLSRDLPPSFTTTGCVAKDSNDFLDDQRYMKQCLEHTSLVLAVLYTNKHLPDTSLGAPSERLDVLLGLLKLKRQPITVGNIAMILSQVPKSLHSAFEGYNCVSRMIQGLIDLRTELFEIEHSGDTISQTHTQTKAAQKNCAIALSKVCATESMLNQVREQKGFEVLYAALDRNPDGSVKE